MATRAELQTQLDTVEAQITSTQQQIDAPGTDFETRQALNGRITMLAARAASLRQQINLMTPDTGGVPGG